jgi:hypothetical protein
MQRLPKSFNAECLRRVRTQIADAGQLAGLLRLGGERQSAKDESNRYGYETHYSPRLGTYRRARPILPMAAL